MQLVLLDAAPTPVAPTADAKPPITTTPRVVPSAPQLLPLATLCEDPANPRTEFPGAELDERAEDIRQHGILQPIVVHPADEQGRHRIHFGAKRWRAAQRAGLTQVPVVVRDTPTDPDTQVAENQKRHGLTPLDLARFIRARVDAGDSNATIAKRLGMDLTSVAHHLALLELPPELRDAMQRGRCTSPRTLHELSTLHRVMPDRVQTLLAGDGEITRSAVAAIRAESPLAATPTGRQDKRPRSGLLAAAITSTGCCPLFDIERTPRASTPIIDFDKPTAAPVLPEAAVEQTDWVGSQINRGVAMKGFVQDIEGLATRNDEFRKVLYTARNCQLVLMALKPQEEIGAEVHQLDQFFRVEAGSGEAVLDGVRTSIHAGFAVLVPAGAKHNIVNTGSKPMKLYTLYAPPNHRDGVVHRTRVDAESDTEHFDGKTSE